MRSQTSRKFWRLFGKLPADVQARARLAYAQWRKNPSHPSLRFKRVSQQYPLYSVRIGEHHRALGLLEGDLITWWWIGSHDDYERMLNS